MRALVLAFALLLTGCGASDRPILVCPEALRQSSRTEDALRDSLGSLKGIYWVTDGGGRLLQVYRYKHDYVPVLESAVTPVEGLTQHISSPLILKGPRKDVVLHVVLDGKECTVPLESAVLERQKNVDVLYVK